MKTAVIYARYSSDSQTEQSIEGQLRVCEDYAKRNNIVIVNTYIDRAMTGTNDNRPSFQQMIKDSYKKDFNFVLVYKLDRFSRDKYQTTIHKHTLKLNGIKVLSAMENIPDSPEGLILESLLEGMNQYYSAELSQKVKRGMKENRMKGFYQGGKIPYGYKLNGKKIVIDENTCDAIKYIFSQYAIGITVPEIIDELTSKRILRNGKPFVANTIYNLLSNEKYTGHYLYENEIVDNMYPKIIDDETFQKVKSRRKVNQYGKKSVKTTYLLKNKLKCGYCGLSMSAECGTTKLKHTIHYYKCLGRKKKHNNCIQETRRKEFLENLVLDEIIKELYKPNIMNNLIDILLTIQKSNDTQSETIKLLERQKINAKISLDNILNAVTMGVVNRTTNEKMLEFEKQIDELERQILIEKSKSNIILTENDIRKFYKEALLMKPELLIDCLIKEIRMFNDKMEIVFNSPIYDSPNRKDYLFLSKISKIEYLVNNTKYSCYKTITLHFYL